MTSYAPGSLRRSMQADNGQTTCKNRTLNHNLPQLDQRPTLMSVTHDPGSQPAAAELEEASLLCLVMTQEARQELCHPRPKWQDLSNN